MQWSEDTLKNLPEKNGFRLRGEGMTRLETFSDAAFAFAMTMLVISISRIPENYDELILALKGVPAFAASFTQIMLFWIGHRAWSRRFGLEDVPSTLMSLALIFVMLVYIYPLRLIFSTLFGWISGGLLPSEFTITNSNELTGLFVIYGVGFGALAGLLAFLNKHAKSVAGELSLNAYELIKTEEESVRWAVQAFVGVVSAVFAWFMPPYLAVFAGFVYCLLPIAMPIIGVRYEKKTKQIVENETQSPLTVI